MAISRFEIWAPTAFAFLLAAIQFAEPHVAFSFWPMCFFGTSLVLARQQLMIEHLRERLGNRAAPPEA